MRNKITSPEVAERVGVESIKEWLRRKNMRWFGYLLRRGEDKEVGRVFTMEVAGMQERG